MTALRALVGRASPCGCPVRVRLIAPDDTPLSVEQARGLMRAQGLRPQIVDATRLIVTPVVCLHAPADAPVSLRTGVATTPRSRGSPLW